MMMTYGIDTKPNYVGILKIVTITRLSMFRCLFMFMLQGVIFPNLCLQNICVICRNYGRPPKFQTLLSDIGPTIISV